MIIKRITNLLLSFLVAGLIISPNTTVFAEETEINHTDHTEINAYYSMDNDRNITEYSSLNYNGISVESITTVTPDGICHIVMKENGIVTTDYFKVVNNYSEYERLYNKQYLPSFYDCNLGSAYYTHYFTSSTSNTYSEDECVSIKTKTVTAVATLLSLKYTKPTQAILLALASEILNYLISLTPYQMKLIENDYDVYFNDGSGMYNVCYHFNAINYDSGGHVTTGGGMTYYQP